jgi:hypothetical protein
MIIVADPLNQFYKEDLFMKKILIFACAFLFVATVAFAAGANKYQVTGPVLEIKGDVIVVKKGNDNWEVTRDAATKVTGDLKVGSKVTIEYKMTATKIEVKDAKKADTKKKK